MIRIRYLFLQSGNIFLRFALENVILRLHYRIVILGKVPLLKERRRETKHADGSRVGVGERCNAEGHDEKVNKASRQSASRVPFRFLCFFPPISAEDYVVISYRIIIVRGGISNQRRFGERIGREASPTRELVSPGTKGSGDRGGPHFLPSSPEGRRRAPSGLLGRHSPARRLLPSANHQSEMQPVSINLCRCN